MRALGDEMKTWIDLEHDPNNQGQVRLCESVNVLTLLAVASCGLSFTAGFVVLFIIMIWQLVKA